MSILSKTCPNTSDMVPLYLPQQLYLKPIARLNMSLQLPNVKKLGKSVSHWEIMDKIRALVKPDEFTVLKVTKTTLEFVRFEGEIETRDKLQRVLSKIDNKMIKLKDFSEMMRVRAAEWKSDFPNRRVWDDFFSNAKDMDEMKPGERPDTVHIYNLPSRWFIPYHQSSEEDIIPSEKLFYRVFEKFGNIRYVDIPTCDPYRKKMKDAISGLKHSSFENTEFFEGYVQFKDYISFVKAMDALRDMKMVRKEDDGALEVNIKVEFDKSKHLSEASIRRREIVRDRLVKKAREKEEKDRAELEEKKRKEELERQKELDVMEQKKLRRKLREEKRKKKILEKLEISGSEEINEKIAKEEKKLLKVQRKLEAIRLVEELFRRIKEKNPDNMQMYDNIPNPARDELRRFKDTSELEVLNQRERLHHALKGRVMLKTILSEGQRTRSYSSSSSDSNLSVDTSIQRRRPRSPTVEKYPELLYDPNWLGYQYHFPPGPMYPQYHDVFSAMRGYNHRGRPFSRYPGMPGPSRGGYNNRRRANHHPRHRGGAGRGGGSGGRWYPRDLEEQYQRYFAKFLDQHDQRGRSHSPRRRSRSPSRGRSRSGSRSRRSRSRGRSRRSHSRDRSRSRSSRTRRSRRSRSRSRSRRTRSRTRERSDDSRRGRSRDKSVDSSAFVTPKQLLERRRDRSESWSLPKEGQAKEGRSWSESPEAKK